MANTLRDIWMILSEKQANRPSGILITIMRPEDLPAPPRPAPPSFDSKNCAQEIQDQSCQPSIPPPFWPLGAVFLIATSEPQQMFALPRRLAIDSTGQRGMVPNGSGSGNPHVNVAHADLSFPHGFEVFAGVRHWPHPPSEGTGEMCGEQFN